MLTDDAEWYENVENLWPRDLYEAQRALRLGLDYADTGAVDAEDSGDSVVKGGCYCGSTVLRGASGPWRAGLAVYLLVAVGARRRRR
jgi:hypothetical protein